MRYRPTKVIFGRGSIDSLAEKVSALGGRVLLCYGGTAVKHIGLYGQVLERLTGLEVHELAGIAPNPRVSSVREGVTTCREHNADVVVAVGGGSTIDCAKAVCAATRYEGDAWEMVATGAPVADPLLLVVVLTVAATGSEMNGGAVISNPETDEKLGYDNDFNQPRVSIMDPTYTISVPPRQTASGCIDVVSHVLEQYFSFGSNYLAEQLMEAAMRTVVRYAPQLMETPDGYEARAQVEWAATIADNGMVSPGVPYSFWPAHAIEHEISAYHDVTRGIGLAIVTPPLMDLLASRGEFARLAQYGRAVFGIAEEDDEAAARAAITATRTFFTGLGAPTTLAEEGVGTEHFADIAKGAVEHNWLGETWLKMDEADVMAVLEACK